MSKKKLMFEEKFRKVFLPLKEKSYQKKFVFYSILFMFFFSFFSSLIVGLLVKDFEGNFFERFMFGLFKNLSLFTNLDWLFFVIASIVMSLMMVNYSFNKCADKKGASSIILGLITATCPACVLPVLGVAGLTTIVGSYNYWIKLGVLLILIFTTVYVADKDECEVKEQHGKKNKRKR